MKRLKIRYFLFFAAMFASIACSRESGNISRFQTQINRQTHYAQDMTDKVKSLLEREAIDSLYQLVYADENGGSQANVLFYIFNDNGLVFWSANWLSLNINSLAGYDSWYYQRFDNAHTICRWSAFDNYSILAVIPIKYNYPFENQWLTNSFLPPFDLSDKYDISSSMSDAATAIYSPNGDFLFSLLKADNSKTEDARLPSKIPTFSYQDLFGVGSNDDAKNKNLSIGLLLLLCGLLLVAMIAWAIYQIVKHRGIKNLPLRDKILFWFGLLLVVSFVYIGFMSKAIIRDRYVEGQKKMLNDKCLYLQAAIKSKVAYMPAITSDQAHDLNIELKELSSAYMTDIHVYDLMGTLVGTTLPELFNSGMRSKFISPEPMFHRSLSSAGTLTNVSEPIIVYERIGQMRYMAGYIECLNWDDIQIGFIAVPFYISENAMREELDGLMLKILPVYIFLILLIILLSMLISRALTHPIAELSKRLRSLDPSQKNEKLVYNSTDEVGDLVESYNKMVDDLNRNVMSLTEKERESAWQTMARQVAHEINNPLTPMKLTVQQMQRAKQVGGERFDAYFDKATGMLIDQIDTLSRIAGSFSAFAKNLPDEINLSSVDVANKLNLAITMFANYQGLTVRYIGPESDVYVYADVEQIGRVFVNILQNAVQAIEQQNDGRQKDIIVMLKQDKQWVEISISDNGPGIPDNIRDKIFLPNFTTKTTGMGLGLAMCKNIVGRSGGELWYESKEGKGTTFFIKLRLV